ncbi:MAG: queuosine salvage family protein [Patescibacteria group bacterium]
MTEVESVITAEKWLRGEWFERSLVYFFDDEIFHRARLCAFQQFELPQWRTEGVHPKNDTRFLEYVFWVHAVNFCFTHPHAPFKKYEITRRNRGVLRGTFALQSRFAEIADYSREGTTVAMRGICESASRMKVFFNAYGHYHIPCAKDRCQIMRTALGNLRELYDNSVFNVFEDASWDAVKLVEILTRNFPAVFGDDYYDDSRTGKRIVFEARALRMALMYEGRAQSSKGRLKKLSSIEKIGPISDHRIPQALCAMGILHYDRALDEKIIARVVFEKNSQEELGIRAGTLVVVEKFLNWINELRREYGVSQIHMGHMDHFLRSSAQPLTGHHITRTTAY